MEKTKSRSEYTKSAIEISSLLSSSFTEEEETGTPIRPIFCLKEKNANLRNLEEKYDCFILDFEDPLETLQRISKLSVSSLPNTLDLSESDDLSLVAEKGKVACRDYPHSRHLCVKYPFDKTPHESYCKLCYCYVCDSAAPCKYWTGKDSAHCHASEHIGDWKNQRTLRKNKSNQFPLQSP